MSIMWGLATRNISNEFPFQSDIYDLFVAEVGALLAEVGDCIKEHHLVKPSTFTPYTISNQARHGVRYPNEWIKYLNKHIEPKAEDNEFFDVEFSPTLEIKTANGKSVKLEMKARVLWERYDKRGRVTATPLITNKPCGGITLLENVCRCNEE